MWYLFMGRSCKASVEGLEKAKRAFGTWGRTQDYLAGASDCDRGVVVKFFARRPIEKRLFQAICTELKLEWGEIAEFDNTEPSQKNDMNAGLQIASENNLDTSTTTHVLVSPSLQNIVNNPAKPHKARIVLTAKLTADNKAEFEDKKEEIEAIIAHLKQLVGDVTLTIQDIQKGSIKITINGSPEGVEKLHELFESGELVDVLGIPVENVELLVTEDTEQDDKKLQLIERIIAGEYLGNDLVGADLSGAFLSKANLRLANLRLANLREVNLREANLREAVLKGANLEGANLKGANLQRANLQRANLQRADLKGANLEYVIVTKALFGNSTGISEEMRRDLESRGAIFGDRPPFSLIKVRN
jgi:Pentapeptide repeats (8 copies)